MKNIVITALVLAVCAAGAEQKAASPAPGGLNSVGYIPVTIRPGTNTVSNLPFTANMRPCVQDFSKAKPGDTFTWKGETHTFDGKAWSGKDGGKALVPIHESFTVIRTANATDVWVIGGELDIEKAMKKKR